MKADFRKNPIINECLFNSRLKASMVMLGKKETVRLVDSIGDIFQSNVTIFNPFEAKIKQDNTSVMRCAIWYHLYNSKSVKHTHGGKLLLVTLLKVTLLYGCSSHFLNCTNGTKSRNVSHVITFRLHIKLKTRN